MFFSFPAQCLAQLWQIKRIQTCLFVSGAILKERFCWRRRSRGLTLPRSMLIMLWGNHQQFVFFYWIFVVRWPAHTWGQINAPPPIRLNRRQSLNRLLKKFREKGTVQDLRKRRPSAREGVEEVTNKAKVEEVSALLDAAHPEQTLRRTGIHQVIIGLGLNKVLITC